MSDVAIKVENLGKLYRIGERERYLALRDVLTRLWQAPFRWMRDGRPKTEAPVPGPRSPVSPPPSPVSPLPVPRLQPPVPSLQSPVSN